MLLQNRARGRMEYMGAGGSRVVGRLTSHDQWLSTVRLDQEGGSAPLQAAGVWIRGLPKLLPASHTWTNINLLLRANSFYTCTNSSRLRVIQEHGPEFVQ